MNQKVKDMEGVLPPTDSRFRDDIRIYEEGDAETADKVKCQIEEEQRRKRRLYDKEGRKWQPMFFEEIDHPHLKKGELETNEETPKFWRLMQGEKSYWNRRKTGDWKGSPSLWGPF